MLPRDWTERYTYEELSLGARYYSDWRESVCVCETCKGFEGMPTPSQGKLCDLAKVDSNVSFTVAKE